MAFISSDLFLTYDKYLNVDIENLAEYLSQVTKLVVVQPKGGRTFAYFLKLYSHRIMLQYGFIYLCCFLTFCENTLRRHPWFFNINCLTNCLGGTPAVLGRRSLSLAVSVWLHCGVAQSMEGLLDASSPLTLTLCIWATPLHSLSLDHFPGSVKEESQFPVPPVGCMAILNGYKPEMGTGAKVQRIEYLPCIQLTWIRSLASHMVTEHPRSQPWVQE